MRCQKCKKKVDPYSINITFYYCHYCDYAYDSEKKKQSKPSLEKFDNSKECQG